MKIRFSTLSEYFEAIYNEKNKEIWPIYKDDFMNYADNVDSYWTGYYVSYPDLKYLARVSESVERFGSIITSINFLKNNMELNNKLLNNLKILKEANAEFQHHDGIYNI
jgi:hypothetical protein